MRRGASEKSSRRSVWNNRSTITDDNLRWPSHSKPPARQHDITNLTRRIHSPPTPQIRVSAAAIRPCDPRIDRAGQRVHDELESLAGPGPLSLDVGWLVVRRAPVVSGVPRPRHDVIQQRLADARSANIVSYEGSSVTAPDSAGAPVPSQRHREQPVVRRGGRGAGRQTDRFAIDICKPQRVGGVSKPRLVNFRRVGLDHERQECRRRRQMSTQSHHEIHDRVDVRGTRPPRIHVLRGAYTGDLSRTASKTFKPKPSECHASATWASPAGNDTACLKQPFATHRSDKRAYISR